MYGGCIVYIFDDLVLVKILIIMRGSIEIMLPLKITTNIDPVAVVMPKGDSVKPWVVLLNGEAVDIWWAPVSHSAMRVKKDLLYMHGYDKDIIIGKLN